jgi:PP-loop superfamily ATP-utilizing enzyme
MRKQRTQLMSTPAPLATQRRTGAVLSASGFALIVDGQAKADFETQDQALKAARELKARFPMLQVKVYDAETKRSEQIEMAAA